MRSTFLAGSPFNPKHSISTNYKVSLPAAPSAASVENPPTTDKPREFAAGSGQGGRGTRNGQPRIIPDSAEIKVLKMMQSDINRRTKEMHETINVEQASDEDTDSSFPPDAQMCQKCTTKAVIKMDGCMTCLNCGESKCG